MTGSKWTRRDFIMRSAGATAAVVGGPVLVGACSKVDTGAGGDLLSKLKDKGTVKVGVANEHPFGFKKGNKVTGEAPEVAQAVFKNMGIDTMHAEAVSSFDSLIPSLRKADYDIICAGMAILPKRCEQIAFSAPDYVTPTALLVPKGNPKNVKDFKDIAKEGVSVAVFSGTIEQSAAKDAGVPDSKIVTFDNQNSLYEGVKAGRAYCGALTDISLRYLLKQRGGDFEITPGFNSVIDGEEVTQAGGFGFRSDNDKFRKAFNKELRKLHESGKWLEIVEPFGFKKVNVPPKDLSTDELCKG